MISDVSGFALPERLAENCTARLAPGFYLIDRYPSLGESDLDIDDIRRELAEAKTLIKNLFEDEVLPEENA